MWDLLTGAFEHGAWLHHDVWPERCDLSPDGRWFVYLGADYKIRYRSASETTFSREVWPQAFTAISRPPWAYALAAWVEVGTYTAGEHFCEKPGPEIGDPFVGTDELHRLPYGLALNDGNPFRRELRRGWVADPASHSSVVKPNPIDHTLVLVASSTPPWHTDRSYTLLHADRGVTARTDVIWADWGRDGRLIAVTSAGTLLFETIGADGKAVARREFHDLVGLKPDPKPAPEWAKQWA